MQVGQKSLRSQYRLTQTRPIPSTRTYETKQHFFVIKKNVGKSTFVLNKQMVIFLHPVLPEKASWSRRT
jgi:hypothetical protein